MRNNTKSVKRMRKGIELILDAQILRWRRFHKAKGACANPVKEKRQRKIPKIWNIFEKGAPQFRNRQGIKLPVGRPKKLV